MWAKEVESQAVERSGIRKSAATRPVSFRLSEDIVNELRREATKKGLDLSALGKDIVLNHLRWGKLSSGLRFIPLPRQTLSSLVNRMSEGEAEESGYNFGKEEVIEMILYANGSLSLDGFFEVLDGWLDASSMSVRHNDEGSVSYLISHEMGKNWSFFLAGLVRGAFEELSIKSDVRFEARSGSLTFSFRKSHNY